jgi:hypothetical protein
MYKKTITIAMNEISENLLLFVIIFATLSILSFVFLAIFLSNDANNKKRRKAEIKNFDKMPPVEPTSSQMMGMGSGAFGRAWSLDDPYTPKFQNQNYQPQYQSNQQFNRPQQSRSVRQEHLRELNRYGRPETQDTGLGGVMPRMAPPDMELKGMLPPVNMSAPGQFPGSANLASAYRNNYPNSGVGDSVISRDPFAVQNLRRDSHMPISWRDNAPCGALAGDDTLFGKWAPTKAAYDNYITASGSARLSLNTRIKNPAGFNPWAGIRSQPPIPISGTAILFNDSSLRQDLIYNSTGVYPTSGMC